MILAFFAGFGLLEWVFLGIWCSCLVGCCYADRTYDKNAPKWIALVIGLGLLLFHFWGEFTFFKQPAINGQTLPSLWEFLQSTRFWVGVGIYLAIGVIYSVVELFFVFRRSERKFGEKWAGFLTHLVSNHISSTFVSSRDNVTIKDLIVAAKNGQSMISRHEGTFDRLRKNAGIVTGATSSADRATEQIDEEKAAVELTSESAKRVVRDFANDQNNQFNIVQAKVSDDGYSLVPVIDKICLTRDLTAWTFLWPFYLLSLIVGDLMVEVFRALADLFVAMSGRLLKKMFSKTFSTD